MNRSRLELGFKDSMGNNFTLYLDNPREDLDNEDIRTSMELIVEKNIFCNKGLALSKIDRARIVRTEIEDFFI